MYKVSPCEFLSLLKLELSVILYFPQNLGEIKIMLALNDVKCGRTSIFGFPVNISLLFHRRM